MKLLVLLAALLLVGCSVEVSHEVENAAQTESLSTSDKSKTVVAVELKELHEPDAHPPSSDRTQATARVVVPEPEVVNSPPPAAPEPTIQIAGSGNAVVLGDVHLHRHEHVHIHKTPKPNPVRVEVHVKTVVQIGEREKRRRMVERRIFEAFPRWQR